MKCLTLATFVLAAMVFATWAEMASAADATTTSKTVVMYFHRTQRCPTCIKMGAYSEEATKAFADKNKGSNVTFYFVDFQNPKNADLAKGYQVSGPALIVAQVKDNKVVNWKNLAEIWGKVGTKEAFTKYVQENIQGYQN